MTHVKRSIETQSEFTADDESYKVWIDGSLGGHIDITRGDKSLLIPIEAWERVVEQWATFKRLTAMLNAGSDRVPSFASAE